MKHALYFALVSVALVGCSGKQGSCPRHNTSGDTAGPTLAMQDTSRQNLINHAGQDRVFFKVNEAKIDSTYEGVMAKQAEWLVKNTSVSVTLEGHCDERGTLAYNQALGLKRAEALKACLVKHGVAAERIHLISYGKERPPVTATTQDASERSKIWAQNRTAIITMGEEFSA